jgi:hypothetical protein
MVARDKISSWSAITEMQHWKRLAYFSAAWLLALVPPRASAVPQEQKASEPASALLATKPPEHPITEGQLRTYFKVVHILSINRQLTHEKMEVQRKKLPEWYPQSVWDEIEDAIDNIDLAKVDLPVYQKYISQDDANGLTKFSATPQAQHMIQAILEKDVQKQHAGAPPLQARDQAIADLQRDEREELNRIVSSMSPEDSHYLESHYVHFQQMQPLLAQMQREAGQATRDKQTELMKAIVAKHQSELADAKRSYEASHPSAPNSNRPQ